MFRKLIVVLSLFAAPAALAGIPTPDILIRSQGDEVRLVWLPFEWPAGLEGYELKRQVVGEEKWISLGTFRPRDAQAYLKPDELRKLQDRLMAGFDFPLKHGFGHVDRTIPADNVNREYRYGLFPIMYGKVADEPSNTRGFHNLDRPGLDVGLRPHEILWTNLGIESGEVVFELDGAKLFHYSLGYHVYEQRGNQTPKLFKTVRPDPKALESKFACYRTTNPYPDYVTLVVVDMFGFTRSESIAIKRSGENVRRGDVASSKCAGTPQAVSLPSPALPSPSSPVPLPVPSIAPPPSLPVATSILPAPVQPPPDEPGSPARNPASLHGMASLWLAANNVELVDERAARWPDQSRSRNDASMNDPARRPRVVRLENGKRALVFENGQSLTLAQPIAHAQMTVFIVGRNLEPSGSAGIILGPAGSNPNHQVRWESDDEVLVVGPRNGSPVTRLRVGDTRKMHVMAIRYDGNTLSLWRSGRRDAVASADVRGGNFSINSIGSYFSQQFLDGEIAEIVVVPRALDAAEIGKIDELLRFKSRLLE